MPPAVKKGKATPRYFITATPPPISIFYNVLRLCFSSSSLRLAAYVTAIDNHNAHNRQRDANEHPDVHILAEDQPGQHGQQNGISRLDHVGLVDGGGLQCHHEGGYANQARSHTGAHQRQNGIAAHLIGSQVVAQRQIDEHANPSGRIVDGQADPLVATIDHTLLPQHSAQRPSKASNQRDGRAQQGIAGSVDIAAADIPAAVNQDQAHNVHHDTQQGLLSQAFLQHNGSNNGRPQGLGLNAGHRHYQAASRNSHIEEGSTDTIHDGTAEDEGPGALESAVIRRRLAEALLIQTQLQTHEHRRQEDQAIFYNQGSERISAAGQAQLVEQVRRSEGEERNQRPQFAAHLDTLFLAHDSTSLSQVTLAHCWRHAPLSGSAFSDQGLANLRKTFFCMHFSALRSPSQSTLSPQTAHALAFVLSLFQVRLSMPFCYKFRHFILHFVYILFTKKKIAT